MKIAKKTLTLAIAGILVLTLFGMSAFADGDETLGEKASVTCSKEGMMDCYDEGEGCKHRTCRKDGDGSLTYQDWVQFGEGYRCVTASGDDQGGQRCMFGKTTRHFPFPTFKTQWQWSRLTEDIKKDHSMFEAKSYSLDELRKIT